MTKVHDLDQRFRKLPWRVVVQMFPVSPYEDRPPLQPMEWEGVYGAPPAQSPAD